MDSRLFSSTTSYQLEMAQPGKSTQMASTTSSAEQSSLSSTSSSGTDSQSSDTSQAELTAGSSAEVVETKSIGTHHDKKEKESFAESDVVVAAPKQKHPRWFTFSREHVIRLANTPMATSPIGKNTRLYNHGAQLDFALYLSNVVKERRL